jgi:hypothetical protein
LECGRLTAGTLTGWRSETDRYTRLGDGAPSGSGRTVDRPIRPIRASGPYHVVEAKSGPIFTVHANGDLIELAESPQLRMPQLKVRFSWSTRLGNAISDWF